MHPIWEIDLFRKVDKFTVECKLCAVRDETGALVAKKFKLPNQSVKSLIGHLSKHDDYQRKYNNAGTAEDAPQGPMDAHVLSPRPSALLSASDKKVMHFLACNSVAFNVVSSPTFRGLFAMHNKIDQLKSEKYYRETVLPQMYAQVKARVKCALKDCTAVSFTTDVWSGPTASYMSLTAHGVASSWARISFVLGCRELTGEHNAERLRAHVEEMLAEWDLQKEQVHCFLHDEGSSVLSAFRLSELEDADCAAHLLHTIIRNAVLHHNQFTMVEGKRVPVETEVTRLLQRCRSAVTHFRHSNLAYERLGQLQVELGVVVHRLIQDVVTRWTSTFDMLMRLKEQRAALDAYFARYQPRSALSIADWQMIDDLLNLLGDFGKFTKVICRDDAPLSYQIAIRKVLHDKLSSYGGSLTDERDDMLRLLEDKFGGLEEYRSHALAHFLDPRFRDTLVDDQAAFRLAVLCNVQSLAIDDADGERSFLSSLGAKYSKTDAVSASQPAVRVDSVETEFSTYIIQRCEDWETDPLKWWKVNANRFPKLAPLAQRYLSAPATSVASERLFSTAGHILDSRRTRLSPQKAEQLIFLNRNLQALGFQY